MPKIKPQVITVNLANVLTASDYVVQPGTQVASILIAAMPAVAGVQIAFEAKNPFDITPGFSMAMGDCNYIDDGISIVNPVALPGQSLVLVIVPYVGGASPSANNAT